MRFCKLKKVKSRPGAPSLCGYRTILYDAFTLMARIMPFEIRSNKLSGMYQRIRDIRDTGAIVTFRVRKVISEETDEAALIRWKAKIRGPGLAGIRVRLAIGHRMSDWVMKRHSSFTFRATQLISSHGCFNDFLYKIRRAPTRVRILSPSH